jgi:hypothetical protein
MGPFVKIVTERLGGLRVTSSAEAGFDEELATLCGENAAEVAKLKPYVVVLSNESSRKVVAYTVSSTVMFQDGRVGGGERCQFKYHGAAGANAAMPRGREILPGERRFIALIGWEIDPTLRDLAYYTRQLVRIAKNTFPETAQSVEVALDAVIDENGVLTGPDTTGLAEMFRGELSAKRDLYKRLLESSAPADLVRSLAKAAFEPPDQASGNTMKNRTGLAEIWAKMAISDAMDLLAFGEHTCIKDMHGALEVGPFAIHRE